MIGRPYFKCFLFTFYESLECGCETSTRAGIDGDETVFDGGGRLLFEGFCAAGSAFGARVIAGGCSETMYLNGVCLFCKRPKSTDQERQKVDVYCDNMESPGDKLAGMTGMSIIRNGKVSLRWNGKSVMSLNSCTSEASNLTKFTQNFPVLMTGMRTPLRG
jgi:hypothetical protein